MSDSARTMPSVSGNPTIAVVKWFYNDYLGMKADASHYARHQNKKNPRALCKLFEYNPELDNAVYKPTTIAELIYYLEDNGVEVRDLGVVTISGLLFSFVNRRSSDLAKRELENTIAYLQGNSDDKQEFNAPSGW